MNKPLVLDFFPYAGEKEILEIRFHELSSVVTKFIIAESNRTQTGRKKPYYFEEQKNNFNDFKDKIIYIKLDDSKLDELGGIGEADWSQEFRMRQCLATEGIKELEKQGIVLLADSIIMISDVDEIPNKQSVDQFIKNNEKIICLNHYFGSYYLNLYSKFREPWGWYGTILLRCGSFNLTPFNIQNLRNNKDRLPHTGFNNEGWHFSSILSNGFRSLYCKLLNNIEPHSKTHLYGYKNIKNLKRAFNKCLYQDKHFFFSDNWDKREIPLEILEIEKLPEYIKSNIDKFKHLLYFGE